MKYYEHEHPKEKTHIVGYLPTYHWLVIYSSHMVDILAIYGYYMVNYNNDNHFLVGDIPTPLKNMKVKWDYSSQYMEKHVPNHQPV
jgi:hypothetical protein